MENDSPAPHLFDDPEHQRQTAALGMWIFLGTEVLFFGALFMAYTFLRWANPAAVSEGSRHLELWIGSVNTAVLFTSSFVVTLALYAHDLARKRLAFWMLMVAAAMGLVFLSLKGLEYAHVGSEGLFPGAQFRYRQVHPGMSPMPGGLTGALGARGNPLQGVNPGSVELFFWLYFVMTAVHAVHLLVGIVCLVVVAAWLRRRKRVSYNTIHNVGLYWHFVDIIWIFLFPLLYLAANWN